MPKNKLSTHKLPLSKLRTGKTVLPIPGVYVLYQTNFGPPRFIGRSDTSLFDKLLQHKRKGGYAYYRFINTRRAEDAFKLECLYWHQAQASIDNSIANGGHHPIPPAGKDLSCPMPGCDWKNVAASGGAEESVMEAVPVE